jgi:hypothetical protein
MKGMKIMKNEEKNFMPFMVFMVNFSLVLAVQAMDYE